LSFFQKILKKRKNSKVFEKTKKRQNNCGNICDKFVHNKCKIGGQHLLNKIVDVDLPIALEALPADENVKRLKKSVIVPPAMKKRLVGR